MIECVRGNGCSTCFALSFFGPITLGNGALCVRVGYKSIYYCCPSFAVLPHDMVDGWIALCISTVLRNTVLL